MVFHVPQYWSMAIDGIQIILCLLILLFLIRNRRNNRSTALEAALKESGKSFDVQVLSHVIKQQLDQAFANIAEAMAAERINLESLLSFNRQNRENYRPADGLPASRRPAGHTISSPADGMSQIDELHQQIQQLAAKGMNVRQIAEELKTPLGEVELILSLKTGAAA
jgi:DNA-binding NarL/FixJ family response regulator